MKYIKKFESSLYRISSILLDDIWDELWKNKKFYYPTNKPNIIFDAKYDKNNDEMYVTILKFSGEYMSYTEISNKYFHGTDEDKDRFKKWLQDLRIVQN